MTETPNSEPESEVQDRPVSSASNTADILESDIIGETIVAEGDEAERRMSAISRRALIQAGVAITGAIGGIWAFNRFGPEDQADGEETGIKSLYRNGLRFNEAVARTIFFSENHRDREFPRSAAVTPRNNYHGETPEVSESDWNLTLEGLPAGPKILTLADLHTLPEVSQTTELKCVEGWSTVVNWTGVRFADFARKFPPPPGTRYVSMRSEPAGQEDTWYYVGLDLESCLHSQTLLSYAMNGAPLNAEHGAPLRLVIPHKYGIKNIKLITHIAYSADRPRDYWAEQGYDWYAGL